MPKRIDKLTKAQEEQMASWAERWIAIGLSTGKSNKKATEKAIRFAYSAAKLEPNIPIIWTPSPMAGALAASIARAAIDKQRNDGDSAVRSAVASAVRLAVGSAVHSAVALAVRSAVDSAVHLAVALAVRSAVRLAVGSAGINWHELNGGTMWAAWPAYISFLVEACDLSLDANITPLWDAYRTISTNCSYYIPNKNFCIVCEKPRKIHLQSGKLHNANGIAISFRDGWGLFALNGTVFESLSHVHQELLGIELEAAS